jgi:sugar/nucleoside kinase (ribokinase family)
LGIKTAAILTLGDDEIGGQIIERLIKDTVDTSYIFRLPQTRSNYSLAINYSGERTIFTYKTKIEYKFPDTIPLTPWIYLTSMGDNFEPVYQKIAGWLREHPEIKLMFNPGSRQIRAGLPKIKEVMGVSYIINVNREEAETLTGVKDSKGKEKELLTELSKLGPKIPIITDGVNGAFVYDGSKFYKVGVMPIDAYERTGAGDAFGSGFLSALIKNKDISEALMWGTVNSASVISYIGAQKGLLKEEEIGSWLDRAKSCNVNVVQL